MDILIVSSSFSEIRSFISLLSLKENLGDKFARFTLDEIEFDLLILGSNPSEISYKLSKALTKKKYDRVLHIGKSFSLKDNISIGSIINIIDDCFGHEGIYSPTGFISYSEKNESKSQKSIFKNEILENPFRLNDNFSHIKKYSGMSLNFIPNDISQVSTSYLKFRPDVISMGGASVLYVCMMEQVACLQLSIVSSRLETAWEYESISDSGSEKVKDLILLLFKSLISEI